MLLISLSLFKCLINIISLLIIIPKFFSLINWKEKCGEKKTTGKKNEGCNCVAEMIQDIIYINMRLL